MSLSCGRESSLGGGHLSVRVSYTSGGGGQDWQQHTIEELVKCIGDKNVVPHEGPVDCADKTKHISIASHRSAALSCTLIKT